MSGGPDVRTAAFWLIGCDTRSQPRSRRERNRPHVDPPLLLADEPTGNPDSRTATEVLELFAALAGEARTVVMVTHDAGLGDRVGRTVTFADGAIATRRG